LFALPAIAETAGSDRHSWQPDGLGYRARISLLPPNDDAVPESELWTMAPEGVSVHVGVPGVIDGKFTLDPGGQRRMESHAVYKHRGEAG
jgi:hypothetical protein